MRRGCAKWCKFFAIGSIDQVDDEKVSILDRLPEVYHDYLDLFQPSSVEWLASRRIFNYTIDIKPDQKPLWGLICHLSETQLKAQQINLDNMLVQGNISWSKSPAWAQILFVPKSDGRLHLMVDYGG